MIDPHATRTRSDFMSSYIEHDHQDDGIDRRGFLACMAWAGGGVLWTLNAGEASAAVLSDSATPAANGDFSFVQISDSHIGFNKDPNKNVIKTFEEAVKRINALPKRPAFYFTVIMMCSLSTLLNCGTPSHSNQL